MKWDWLKSLSRKLSASIQEIINYSINYPLCASWEFLWCSLSSISDHIFNITKWFWCLPQNGSAAMRLIAILKSCLHPKSHPVTSTGDDIMYHSALTPSVFGKWEVQKKCESQTAKLFESLTFGKLWQFSNPKFVWHGEVSKIDNLPNWMTYRVEVLTPIYPMVHHQLLWNSQKHLTII